MFEGRVFAVAGAGGSLGPAVVERLAALGASLALAGRDEKRLERSTHAVLDPSRIDLHAVDLCDEAACKKWVHAVVDRFGGVDGLIHLVGGWRAAAPLAEASLRAYDLLHESLVRTALHTSRAFAPYLIAAGSRGRFVLVSSSAVERPRKNDAAYASAKAAAEAWTLALADELTTSGATSNIVVVKAIATEQMREARSETALATFTDAVDVAEAIAFVCSDAAQAMNGQRLILCR